MSHVTPSYRRGPCNQTPGYWLRYVYAIWLAVRGSIRVEHIVDERCAVHKKSLMGI